MYFKWSVRMDNECDRADPAYGAVKESNFLFLIGSDIMIELEALNEGSGKKRK